MRRLTMLVLVALAGCSLMDGARSGTLLAAPAPTSVIPVGEGDGSPTRHVVREQLETLIGKEPDQAKQLLRSYGHDGEVTVKPGPHHYDECKMGRVCAFDVPESGMGTHDPITLFVNPALKIAPPPP